MIKKLDIGDKVFILRPSGRAAERRKISFAMPLLDKIKNNSFIGLPKIIWPYHSEIPINAGTSSSSALVVTWVNFLAQMSDQQQQLSPEECARLAHAAEVLEFHEPGGMMDHYAAACGGVLALRFHPTFQIEKLSPPLRPFVLGDSNEPKETKSILAHLIKSVGPVAMAMIVI